MVTNSLPVTRLYVNPRLFFFIQDNAIYLWDYANGAQFEVEEDYLARIAEIATNPDVAPDFQFDEDLKTNNIISEKPFPPSEWGFGKPAEIFHFATRHPQYSLSESNPTEFTAAYVQSCEEQFDDTEYHPRVKREGPRIHLPSPNLRCLKTCSLWDSLTARKSCRTFDGRPISLVEISTLLYASFGEVHGPWTHLAKNGLRELGIRRTSPSGGGIHPSQAYLVAMNVEGLEPGVYFYNGDVNDLTLISSLDLSNSLPRYLGGQPFVSGAAAGIFVTSILGRVWKKYPSSRAYRIPLLDIGHLSQTFHLSVAALGLQSWLTAAFDDEQISGLLKISDPTENPFLFLAVGHGNGDQLWPELVNFINVR
jgi:SagB-type dehydrogenase family enzyme